MAGRKRRSWSDEEKRSICLQTTAPGVSVAQVARRYVMNANQIFNWLKDARYAPVTNDFEADTAVFIPVDVCCEPTNNSLPSVLEPANTSRAAAQNLRQVAAGQGHPLCARPDAEDPSLSR